MFTTSIISTHMRDLQPSLIRIPIDMIRSFTNIRTYQISITDTGIRELGRIDCISTLPLANLTTN